MKKHISLEEVGNRIEANTIPGMFTRDNTEAQIFGRWGSSERIHDLATMFMLPEEQTLPLMKKYDISYAVVFIPHGLQKFSWIAQIAGLNASDSVVQHDGAHQPTARGSEVTSLHLVFKDLLPSQHFTQVCDNDGGEVYRVDYS